MIFCIPSCKHIADAIPMQQGSATFKQFTDGEWHVSIHDKVKDREVWVVAQTAAPSDTIIQLLLLCDALVRAGATIKIVLSYMGYARQDRLFPGQALSAEVMCSLLQVCQPRQLHAVQLHNPSICSHLFKNHIPYQFFYDCAKDVDIIVAPDKGASAWAKRIAQEQSKELICIEKHRPEPERVVMQVLGDTLGKRALIVDDMITTGGTILQAAQLLFEQGAKAVRVACTHGVFTGNARENLEVSKIEKIYVTNTLEQKQISSKIAVIDIAPFITSIIQE